MKKYPLLLKPCLLLVFMLCSSAFSTHRLKIVFFGDSITARWPSVERVFAQRVPELLAQQGIVCDAVISGMGSSHSGRLEDNDFAKVRHGLERFEAEVLAHDPDIVVIGFGTNDAYIDSNIPTGDSRISLEKYEANLAYMIRALQERGVKVILRTPCPFAFPEDRMYQDKRLQQYARVVRGLARRYRTGLSDNYKLFKSYGASQDGYMRFFPDGVHPNDEGHALIAQSVAKEIRKKIKM